MGEAQIEDGMEWVQVLVGMRCCENRMKRVWDGVGLRLSGYEMQWVQVLVCLRWSGYRMK